MEEHRIYDYLDYLSVNNRGDEDNATLYSINDDNDDAQWINHDDGYVTFCIKHKMKSLNGAVAIKVNVMNTAGNVQEDLDINNKATNNSFTVIKKDFSDFYNPERYEYTFNNGGFSQNSNDFLSEKCGCF